MSVIIWYEFVDSTNSEIRKRIDEFGSFTVLSARNQTAGRGQRGNIWSSAPGMNLTFSILLKSEDGGLPFMDANCQFVISEAIALGICHFLEEEGIRTSIKWPNDIYVGDRKICGILIENTLNGKSIRDSICGIGLNLNQTDFPEWIPNPISAASVTGREYELESTLERLVSSICMTVRMISEDPEMLEKEYLDRMYRKDTTASYTDTATGEVFKGKIRGIDNDARLIVETEDGRILKFAFKEISYII